jgi:hypothetical protein
MAWYRPTYRTDYIGETINSNRNGQSVDIFVPPRPDVFTKVGGSDAAIVVGNGLTRDSKEVQQLLRVNANKIAESYKLTYACNRAITDDQNFDYYVLKHRAFLSEMPVEKRSQVYLPFDIFLDYPEDCNLIPYKSYYDSGITAAYIAAFDGHKKVFLLGFDGNTGAGWKTVYDNKAPYGNGSDEISYEKWTNDFAEVMKTYNQTNFYRLQLDGQSAPDVWSQLANFRDVDFRTAILLGDF